MLTTKASFTKYLLQKSSSIENSHRKVGSIVGNKNLIYDHYEFNPILKQMTHVEN